LAGGTLTGALNGTTGVFSGDLQSSTRVIAVNGGESIILHPNSGGSINRIEGSAGAPLHIVTSGSSLAFAAGGTTPQMILSNVGNLSLSGSAIFASSVTATGNAASTPSFIANNQSGTSGTAQHYINFTAGGTVLGRILRGNGASGLVANGLNIDNFDGCQIRLNQLGGSGGSFNVLGGNVLINTTTDAGFKLDVNGTGRFSGALTGTTASFTSSSTLLTLTSGAGTKAVFATTRNFGVNRNFQIAVDEFAESAFTITPSTTLGGSGYTTPIFTLAAAGGATFSSSVTASGAIKLLTAANGNNAINFGTSAVNYHTITYDDSTGKLTFNTDSSRIVSFLNSNVGIGTASPAWMFEVNKDTASGSFGAYPAISVNNPNAAGFSAYYFFSGATNKGGFEYSNSSNNLFIFGNGFERMRITSGGNVLIGTTTDSGSKLQVSGSVTATGGFIMNPQNTSLYETNGALSYYATNNGVYLNGAGTSGFLRLNAAGTENNNTAINIYGTSHPGAAGQISLVTAGTDRLTVKSGGNVGIGTASPSDKLEVQDGYINTYHAANVNSAGYGVQFLTNGGGSKNTLAGIYLFQVGTARSGDLRFATSNAAAPTERMRITSDGYLKASNDGTYLNAGAYHEIRQTGNDANIVVFTNTSASPYGPNIYFTAATPNNTTNYFLTGGDNTNDKFFIYSNGNMVNRNGSYGTISDVKFKENIVDATSKLEDILKLKVRNFNLIGEEQKHIGFIAQEFEEVFPSMVDTSLDRITKEEYKSIKTSVLIPMLVKAIQEQQEQINKLKNA
jgi:hypothetical protein